MKKIHLIILMVFLAMPCLKAQTPEDSVFKFSLYGFVRNDFAYDSRKTMGAVGELFSFLPYDEKLNIDGSDENAVPNTRLLAVVSRLGFNFATPTYKNDFNITAKIEADFCGGGTNIFFVRIRQAYAALNWRKMHNLTVGQTWHPLTINMLPNIVSLNTGAPFNPFSRTPLIQYNFSLKGVKLSAAAIYQFQYNSPGPEGNSTAYQVQGGLPEFYIGADYKAAGFNIGIAGEFMQIRPRHFDTASGDKLRVNEHVNSWVGQLYLGHSSKNVDVKVKTTLGQNMGHILMMSGYAATGAKTLASGATQHSYSAISQSATWATLAYHTNKPTHNVTATVFAGYMRNLGTGKDLVAGATPYTRGPGNIHQMGRVAPSVIYSHRCGLQVGVEYEYTGVNYGTLNSDATVTPTRLVNNHRIYAMLVYNFSHTFKSRK